MGEERETLVIVCKAGCKNNLKVKFSYWVYFIISLIAGILFVVMTRENGDRHYAFLGLAIGGVIRGVYEFNKENKSKNQQ